MRFRSVIFQWLNSRTMVVLDTSERAHVLDVRTEEVLEVVDMADVQLVYSTRFVYIHGLSKYVTMV